MKKGLMTTLLITTLLLSACSRTQIGWAATNIGNTFEASYRHFDGQEVETYQLETDETFELSYSVEVQEGSLTLEMLDPEDTSVWKETFSADTENSFEFNPETDGRYQLRVIGNKTQGSFDLDWEITE